MINFKNFYNIVGFFPPLSFRELKRSSAPAEVSEQTKQPEKSVSPKTEIQKDADSDFMELKPLDDVDVSDQLIRKRPVSLMHSYLQEIL